MLVPLSKETCIFAVDEAIRDHRHPLIVSLIALRNYFPAALALIRTCEEDMTCLRINDKGKMERMIRANRRLGWHMLGMNVLGLSVATISSAGAAYISRRGLKD